jgi:hypothetical protein
MAALIADYLDTLRWQVLTDGEDGGPGDAWAVTESRRAIRIHSKRCRSIAELNTWMGQCGGGGLLPL